MSRKKVKVLEYNAIFQKEDGGSYSVWVPDLPGCASQGENFEEAERNIQEAIELYLEDAEEDEYWQPNIRSQFMAPVDVKIYA